MEERLGMELSDKRRRNQLRINIRTTQDQLGANSGRRSIIASMSLMTGLGAGEDRALFVPSIP